MGLLTAATVAGLGTPADDGQLGFILLPSGHKELLVWNAAQNAWVGQPKATMKQVATSGMQTSGSPSGWKYPVFVEPNLDPPQQRAYGFEIHTLLDASEFTDAGLTLQEHLSAEIRRLSSGYDVDSPQMALSWYSLADDGGFLSPLSINHGVKLLAPMPVETTSSQYRFFFASSGWQNSPIDPPDIGENYYPELYVLGNDIVFRRFAAKHRWVGGTVGGAGSSEKASKYPDLPHVASWHSADDIALADLGSITEWADFSGEGRHLQQSNAGKRPTIHRSGGPNGHSFVRFDGVDDFLSSSLLGLGTGPLTIVMVVAQRGGGGSDQVWVTQNAGSIPLFYSHPSNELHWWGGGGSDLIGDIGAFPMPWSVITLRSDGANTKITKNGVTLATGDHGDGIGTGIAIGAKADGRKEVIHAHDWVETEACLERFRRQRQRAGPSV
jgi:hypothetical protein